MSQLRGAVFGAGRMGRHHVRIMSQHPDVELVGVVDPDLACAQEVAAPWGAPVFASMDELPPIDVAVVVTPTHCHGEIALTLIERNVNLLIEKPLAECPETARQIVDAAKAAGVKLAVGHVERFNPAIQTLSRLSDDPKMISIERLSPYTPRIKDSVIYDLTVHDVDLACWLAKSSPVKVSAAGTKVFSETIDVASTVIEFENGCIATIQTSRVTQDKVRRITIAEPERFFIADTLRQEIEIKREAEVKYTRENDEVVFSQASVVEIPTLVSGGEPLRLEQDDFYDAVLSKREPLVTGEDGLRAVELVEQIEALCTT
ncbi:MAG: Gfo/Idh/MocA family oxidoreductase [Coriobacteriia bacterium]|nr:Gfo/Idh/MocA family oxidoreductase [Coriobacteriia bacterium]